MERSIDGFLVSYYRYHSHQVPSQQKNRLVAMATSLFYTTDCAIGSV